MIFSTLETAHLGASEVGLVSQNLLFCAFGRSRFAGFSPPCPFRFILASSLVRLRKRLLESGMAKIARVSIEFASSGNGCEKKQRVIETVSSTPAGIELWLLSVGLYSGRLHDRPPFVEFSLVVSGKRLRRQLIATWNLVTKIRELFLHGWIRKSLNHHGVNFGNNVSWCAFRRP